MAGGASVLKSPSRSLRHLGRDPKPLKPFVIFCDASRGNCRRSRVHRAV